MTGDRRPPSGASPVGAAAFDALYQRLKRTEWGEASDRRGALNNLTATQVVAAAREVRSGKTVSLARAVEVVPSADNPDAWRHEMISRGDEGTASGGLGFSMDRFIMNVHGNADSHIDALCHVVYDGKLYDDVSVDTLTPAGASALSIAMARDGIVGRGVLLDIPQLRGVPWLEPGDCVTVAELLEAERAQDVRVERGDILFVRVGHTRRRAELGPWDAATARAGLHPTAMEFVADRQAAVLGSDGNNDTAPSMTEGVAFPVHVLAIHAMGVHLLDYLQFEDLVALCEEQRRWTFFCVIAPLRLPEATGSPVNPIAIL